MCNRDYLLTVWKEHDNEPVFDAEKHKYLVYNPEVCPTTGNHHWQTYVYLMYPMRICGCQKSLGLGKKNKVIKPRGSGESCAEYCKKLMTRLEGKTFSEFGTMPTEEELQQGRRNDIHTVTTACLEEDADETDIAMRFPIQYIKYHAGIAKLIQHSGVRQCLSDYSLDDFQHWKRLNIERGSQLLVGAPGIGKSEFAKAHFKTPLFISHIDKLTGFKPKKYDGIIFDDMSFRHLPRETQIAILDWDNDRDIHVRYSTAYIPRHTKKIFTANLEEGYPFNLSDKAIARRVTVTEVTERVIV